MFDCDEDIPGEAEAASATATQLAEWDAAYDRATQAEAAERRCYIPAAGTLTWDDEDIPPF